MVKTKLKNFCKIEQDNKRLRIRVTLGKSKYVYIYPKLNYSHESIRNVQKLILEINADIETNNFDFTKKKYNLGIKNKISYDIKFKDAFIQWQNLRKKGLQKNTIIYGYSYFNKFYNTLKFKNIRLEKINYSHINSFVNNKEVKKLNKRTIKDILNMFTRFYDWCLAENLLNNNFNPFKNYLDRLPPKFFKEKKQHDKKETLTQEETKRLLRYIEFKNCKYKLYWKLKLLTGLRTGEALGLRWIDFSNNFSIIYIQRQFTNGKVKPPKNNSYRRFELPDELKNDLIEQFAKNKVKNLNDYIFCNSKGNPISVVTLSEDWKRILINLKIKNIPAYNTRHTFISNKIYTEKNPVILAKITGHTLETMLKIYAKYNLDILPKA